MLILSYKYKYKRKHNQTIYDFNERTNTLLYKKYISHTLFLKGLMFLWCVRDGWRDILRERTTSSHIFFQGVPTLAPPCKLVRDASGRLRVPRSIAILCTQSKSDRLVLITWSPSSYTPVRPECPDRAVLFTNHNVTACQSTRGHYERTENPWHMLYNRSIHIDNLYVINTISSIHINLYDINI